TIYNEYAIMYEMQSNPQTAMDYYQKAAMVTLENGKLDRYKEGIERCQKKLDLLKPSVGF
ncbi:MAG: hypothetical protein M3Q33_03910, partial [Acidobacteriota bacterium]|nr:hypothetical protein [Acidobacteriota bacterium]